MTKNTTLITLAFTTLLLTACGGSKDTKSVTEQLKERNIILIIEGMNQTGCSTVDAGSRAEPAITNIITNLTSSTVSCSTYGRIATNIKADDLQGNCAEQTLVDFFEDLDTTNIDISIFEDASKSCVLGFNIQK